MRAVDIIIKKRDKGVLTREEIDFFVEGFTRGDIPDYQAAAFAMAVMLNGMNAEETTYLTLAMARSGEVLDLTGVVDFVVDKHSTGGVGDKTTLVVEPAVATCGLPVGKMSGRGLGFTGGTLDKLESIPGYRTDLSTEEFIQQLKEIGLVLTGQSKDLAPADGKLYALRDVTGTVPSIPLIASSVMSKKIAGGAHAIVLDVKVGLGAFMETLESARELSRLMVDIGRLSGRKVVALLSDMNQPLGQAVGNALELKEAIDTLHGGGPEDFREHCLVVASHMLKVGGKAASLEEARQMVERVIAEGKAWEKFRQLVAAQGGDVSYVDHPEKLPAAPVVYPVLAQHSGYLAQVHARMVGETAVVLGAGRSKKEDPIDHGVGIIVHVKVGDRVEKGQPLFTVHARTEADARMAEARLLDALTWSDQPVSPLPLFYGVIE
ncbi:pyrimidine-nucleoside phosphorylase [Anaerolinea sp.]|uniref:pyrimidine-nucleoside phosphorylase n=1 Tax=Anaerolinea sp. TaxID=1872519 RepID=UPI002ACDF0FB|nr:pyrimidine-nucleoside phosphorylase [Anaerolinea sp.]